MRKRQNITDNTRSNIKIQKRSRGAIASEAFFFFLLTWLLTSSKKCFLIRLKRQLSSTDYDIRKTLFMLGDRK